MAAIILSCGSLIYGLVSGVPQWTGEFQGTLVPLISAYDGWAVTIGIVVVGVLLVGGCVALSWYRATFDYLLVGLGLLAVLVFITLGLPPQLVARVDAALSFVMVGLCAVLLAKVFFAALKDRFTRRYRV